MEEHTTAFEEEENDHLDPRIHDELEKLNTTSAEINRLEKELDDARQLFRQTLSDSSTQLNEKARQNKRSIRKALAYHKANEIAKKAHKQAQEAAHKYHRAVDIYNAAKETIAYAEEASVGNGNQRVFDAALQELVNYTTMKLNNAEVEKKRGQAEHDETSQTYMEAKQSVEYLAKKFKRSIAKSRPFYETKAVFHSRLQDIKTNVEALQGSLSESKKRYKDALRSLETISEDIHQRRKVEMILKTQHRGSGVGADSASETDIEELQVKFDIDEDALSDVDSVDTGGRNTPVDAYDSIENLQHFHLHKRNNSGSSQSETGDNYERERGDGLSPIALVSCERPFDSEFNNNVEEIEKTVQLTEGKNIAESSRNSSRTEHEISEESGFAEGGEESDDSSHIDIDLMIESDTEVGPQPQPKKPLRKLIPDLTNDGEIWL